MKPLEFLTKAPGKKLSIGNIPTAITNDHNEVFYYWMKSGIRNATLLHVDAHSDMLGAWLPLSYTKKPLPKHWRLLSIEGFICPAFHAGVVSHIFWINPHLDNERITEIGIAKPEKNKYRLMTFTGYENRNNNSMSLHWDMHTTECIKSGRPGRITNAPEINFDNPLILDIDLDAFYRIPMDEFAQYENNPCSNYRKKISETASILRDLGKRPDLITITRSAGGKRYKSLQNIRGDLTSDDKTIAYVPKDMINILEKTIMNELKALYE